VTLQQLTKIWDKKLKDDGFVDIENRQTGLLNTWSGKFFYGTDTTFAEKINREAMRRFGSTHKESEAEYFRLASHCLHEQEFKSVRHRIIWQLHAEGYSYNEIAKELNTTTRKVRYAIEIMAKAFCLK
jgi:DNA-binding NarL/FixJ family response regulator